MKLLSNSCETSADFCPTDTVDLYQTNLSRMPKDWIWRTASVHYTLNSQGYRCPEWKDISWRDSILLLGCSRVFGIGLDDTQTCSAQLSLMLNTPVINLGQGGTSSLFQWANTCRLISEGVAPRAVIYLWPESSRIDEFIDSHSTRSWGAWDKQGFGTPWVLHEYQGLEFLKHAVISTSAMWTCPILHYNYDYHEAVEIPGVQFLNKVKDDWARDWDGTQAHPGPLSNKVWAETMASALQGRI